MKPNRALWNRCPEDDCREEALWMPYEERCGKCGYGGSPPHSTHSPASDVEPAKAKKPLEMALAFKNAVLAGRQSYRSGRIDKILMGNPSSPSKGII